MTPLFDTDVQELKYKVLKEVAALTLNDTLTPQNTMSIAEILKTKPITINQTHHHKTKSITIKPKTASHMAEQSSWVP